MEYQGKPVSMQELPGFAEGLPNGSCYILEKRGESLSESRSNKRGLVIPKSRLIKAIQSSEIPFSDIIVAPIDLNPN